MTLEIKTAAELHALGLPRSWKERAERRDARRDTVLHEVWRQFLEHGGPVPTDAIEGALTDPADQVRASLRRLDAADLLIIEGAMIQVAYPFTAGPNVFAVEVATGSVRYTCCAIDALGIAPMLGQPVTIQSRCHSSGAPLLIETGPEGPRSSPDVMIWVASREDCGGRVASGL